MSSRRTRRLGSASAGDARVRSRPPRSVAHEVRLGSRGAGPGRPLDVANSRRVPRRARGGNEGRAFGAEPRIPRATSRSRRSSSAHGSTHARARQRRAGPGRASSSCFERELGCADARSSTRRPSDCGDGLTNARADSETSRDRWVPRRRAGWRRGRPVRQGPAARVGGDGRRDRAPARAHGARPGGGDRGHRVPGGGADPARRRADHERLRARDARRGATTRASARASRTSASARST